MYLATQKILVSSYADHVIISVIKPLKTGKRAGTSAEMWGLFPNVVKRLYMVRYLLSDCAPDVVAHQ